MDLAKGALSAALYFVPPKVVAKLKPTFTTLFHQLRVLSGGDAFPDQDVNTSSSALQSATNSQSTVWDAASPLVRSPSEAALDLSQGRGPLHRRPKATISVTVDGDGARNGVTLNFPVPSDAKSVHVSFQESAAGSLDIAFDQEVNGINGGASSSALTWRGVRVNGVGDRGLQQSQPLARDVVAYLELLYCVFFVGAWVFRAMGPLLDWAKSASKVLFAEVIHWGAHWLARVLRMILASLPEEV